MNTSNGETTNPDPGGIDEENTRRAARAARIHGARCRHPDPRVRADAHVKLAALSPAPDASARLTEVLDEDAELADHPEAAQTIRAGAHALDIPGEWDRLRENALSAAGTSDTRKEAREAVHHPNSAWNMDEKKGNVANNAWVGDPAKATTGFEPPRGTRGGGGKLTQTERERVRAIERGKALILPQTLNEAFERLSERLRYISAPGTFVLGGGTVLAARYKHRESTDLDVFCSLSTSEQIDREHGERVWINHLEEWIGENPDRTVGAMAVVGKIGDVPFSVCPANGVLETGTPQEIYGHNIAGQTTHEILEGKILGRIIDENTPNTIRDLYDITVAARLEPQAMRSVLTKLARWPRQVERAAESLNDTPSDLHKTDPKPIIKARYDLEFADLAKRLIPMIRSAEPGQAPTTRPTSIKNKKNPKGGWER